MTAKQRSPLQSRAERARQQMQRGATGGLGYGARVGQTISGALGRGAGGQFVRVAERETIRERNERLRAILAEIRALLRTPGVTPAGSKRARSPVAGRRLNVLAELATNRQAMVERIVQSGYASREAAAVFLAFIDGETLSDEQQAVLVRAGLLDETGNLTRAGRRLKVAYARNNVRQARQAIELATKEGTHTKSMIEFGRSVRAAARPLWRGEDDGYYFFVDTLNSAVLRGYEQAWREGASMCGILPQDRTPEEQARLAGYISIAQSRVVPLADYIQEHNRPNGGKWGDLQPRLDIWIQRYNEVRETAKGMSCADAKAEWVYGDTIDHCDDCSAVVGKVYRLSIWDKYGWVPGSRALACGGWRCDCKRVPTDKPVTPGRPPNLRGPKK